MTNPTTEHSPKQEEWISTFTDKFGLGENQIKNGLRGLDNLQFEEVEKFIRSLLATERAKSARAAVEAVIEEIQYADFKKFDYITLVNKIKFKHLPNK
jgi:hypothetical protein